MKTDLNKLRDYKITTQDPLGEITQVAVKGYRVIFDGFEEYQFFVHRPHNLFTDEWRVSEVSCGFAFPFECDGQTRLEAIDNAARLLYKTGLEKFRDSVMAKAQAKLDEAKV